MSDGHKITLNLQILSSLKMRFFLQLAAFFSIMDTNDTITTTRLEG